MGTRSTAPRWRALESEVAATGQQSSANYRRDAWAAAGTHGEGMLVLLHYTDLDEMHERVTTDLGVLGAASGTSQTLKLLLEVLTVRATNDPRAENITPNLARAADQLETAAEQLHPLFAAGRDAATILGERS